MQVAEACQRPIGIFWDIENCQVPKNKSATDLCRKIRNYIVKPRGFREFEFFCGCDTTTIPKQVCEELNLAGVTIAHVPSSSKNAADEKIKEQMTKFVDCHGSRATVMLISGDINFAPTLRGFRDRIGAHVLLMHSASVAQELKNCADEKYSFPEFCEDLQVRQPSSDNNAFHVKVDGLPKDMTAQSIRRELQMSTQNRGGKVAQLTHESAIIKFPCQRDAERALGGINGNKIGNATVSAKIVPTNGQKPVNAAAAKKKLGAPINAMNMLQMQNALPLNPMLMGTGFPGQPSLLGGGYGGFPIQQNATTAARVQQQIVAVPAKENSKTFRLIVSGISGKLPPNEVRARLLSSLTKKPKSIIVADGNADLEFSHHGWMEEAYSRFNGLIFEGLTLTARKVYKPRTNSDEHRANQAQKTKDESLKQKWSNIQEMWKKDDGKVGGSMTVAFSNQSNQKNTVVAPSATVNKPPELKGGRFMRIILPQSFVDDPVVFTAKLQILVKANNGSMIDISKQEAWVEFANQTAAEEAKRVFQSSFSAPGFCLNAETTNFIPPNIYELRKKMKELQAKNVETSGANAKADISKPKETPSAQSTKPDKNKALKAPGTENTKNGKVKPQKGAAGDNPTKSKPQAVDAPQAENAKPENKTTYLLISGLSSKLPLEQVREALSELFVAFDGNVVNIANGCAYVKFDNGNNAEAASQLFTNNNVTIMDKPIRAQLCTKTPKLAVE